MQILFVNYDFFFKKTVTQSLFIIYPEIYLIYILCFLIVFLVILDDIMLNKYILITLVHKISICLLIYIYLLLNNISIYYFIFNDLFIIDSFNIFIKKIIIFFTIFCFFIFFNYIKYEKIYNYEYFYFFIFSIFGMFTFLSANNLLVMYFGIELQSLCFYVLALLKIFSNFSTEASLKYFILSAFSSGFLLLGCSFLYYTLGIVNFSLIKYLNFELNEVFQKLLILSFLFIIISFLFKIGSAPFHM